MNAEALQAIGLAIFGLRSPKAILQTVVEALASQDGVALARAWLIDNGDICASCPMRSECPDQERCLHLTASAGAPIQESIEDWSRLDGTFRRFPLGVRKVGRVGSTGCAMLLKRTMGPDEWVARPAWAARESISGFAGQPIIFQGVTLGVLALFSRRRIEQKEFERLRNLADQAAAAVANARAFEEIDSLRRRSELESSFLRDPVEMVGGSLALANVLRQVELVGPTDANVLVCGEPGTGKELVARRIHKSSLRSRRPLIKIDCAVVAADQIEADLFGHHDPESMGRAGGYRAAEDGTILLDEPGLMPPGAQDRLARAMRQEPSTRVIVSTNRDLGADVEAGLFRAELLHRLGVFRIDMPPLRSRVEDIPRLAEHFLRLASRRLGRQPEPLSPEQLRALKRYEWPGNVTELRQVVERSVMVAGGGPPRPEGLLLPVNAQHEPPGGVVTDSELRRRERGNLETALRRVGWKIYGPDGAALMLGMKPTTLASRMKALGIRRPR